jgi:DNA helicase HerA-like ATPase
MANNSAALIIAKATKEIGILPKMANRHGLIAGATGTGKTVTLRVMAELFSNIGVPVFMADVKGDLSGIASAGGDRPEVAERAKQLGLEDFSLTGCPTVFWDVFGLQGHPVRTTISEIGPLLLSRILNLNDVQAGVLSLIFRIADDNGLLLLDLKDLRSMTRFVGDNASTFKTQYGNVSAASIGAIQRGLIRIEEQGGEAFFGEPALDLADFMQTDASGKGVVNILAAEKLVQSPSLYATFLLWMLAELFETLPEAGDPEKPKLVFFFDEAHLLFNDAPKTLRDRIEQVVRLIRSKGVGVYFVTQNPLDIPETVLGQLGNRVQHALRAFTPRDQKAVKAAAETFRGNPGLDVARAIMELGVGEALVSVLDAKGIPTAVERALVCPPRSRLSPLSVDERSSAIKQSVLLGHYEALVDRESAYEKLKARAGREEPGEPVPAQQGGRPAGPRSGAADIFDAMAKSAARAIGSQIGRQIIRGALGSILGGGRRRN